MLQEKLPIANTTCEVCGTKYYACQKCIKLMHMGTYGWKLTCCTHACFQMKMLFDSYQNESIDRVQAKEFIETLSLPVEVDNLQEKYKSFIDEINTTKQTKKAKSKSLKD